MHAQLLAAAILLGVAAAIIRPGRFITKELGFFILVMMGGSFVPVCLPPTCEDGDYDNYDSDRKD